MSSKRRQRSTAIRKRIEKKNREDERARRKVQKREGRDSEILLIATVDREAARSVSDSLTGLAQRLAAAPIRGWTSADVGGPQGLAWLGEALGEALALQPPGRDLELSVNAEARRTLLDRLTTLEMAAPGLGVDWDAGFPAVGRALSQATEQEEEEEEPAPEPAAEGDPDAEPAEGEDGAAEGADSAAEEPADAPD